METNMLTWSRKMFPGTNLQDLNLDWILRKIAALRGGSAGQYLYKKSNKDFDFGWKTGSGGGGASDYLDLDNKPSINNIELTGNKTASDLGLATPSDIPVVPVQSVNEKTGAVVLSASDVGAYVKPASGIPETDLSSDVQTSLNKAESALQAVPPTYRTAAAQDTIDAAQDAQIDASANANEIAIVITGARPSLAVTSGQYVIVRNSTISGIADGLYTANSALSPSTDVTAANLTAVSNGGLNDIRAISTFGVTANSNALSDMDVRAYRCGNLACLSFDAVTNNQISPWTDTTIATMTVTPVDRVYMSCFTNDGLGINVQLYQNSNEIKLRPLNRTIAASTGFRGTVMFFINL